MTTFVFGTQPALAAAGNLAVPDVVGMQRAEAEATINRAGFTAVVNIVESKLPELDGTVYRQDPTDPSLRPENSIVTLDVVHVAVPVTAPDFTPRFDALDEAVKGLPTTLETEANAKARFEQIMERLDSIESGASSGSSGSPAKTGRASTQA